MKTGKVTTEQIFILRNILEQANEWRGLIYTYFVDFEKKIDSVHKESLWAVMKSYGVQDMIIRAIRGIYEGFECAYIEENET